MIRGRKKTNKLIIRLRPHGCRHKHLYDIVLSKQKSRIKGAYLDKFGIIMPHYLERRLNFNSAKIAYCVRHGAHMHPMVKRYLVKCLVN